MRYVKNYETDMAEKWSLKTRDEIRKNYSNIGVIKVLKI